MSILQHYRTLLPCLLRHKLFEINAKQIHYKTTSIPNSMSTLSTLH